MDDIADLKFGDRHGEDLVGRVIDVCAHLGGFDGDFPICFHIDLHDFPVRLDDFEEGNFEFLIGGIELEREFAQIAPSGFRQDFLIEVVGFDAGPVGLVDGALPVIEQYGLGVRKSLCCGEGGLRFQLFRRDRRRQGQSGSQQRRKQHSEHSFHTISSRRRELKYNLAPYKINLFPGK